MILLFLLLSLFGKSVFSSKIEDAGPKIEEINIILDNKPTSPTLSTFLSEPENWAEFSKALNDGGNQGWFSDLLSKFKDEVVNSLLPHISNEYPVGYGDTVRDLLNFTFSSDNVDEFFRLWIKILGHLKELHKKASDENVLKNIDGGRLPTAAEASNELFILFQNKIVEPGYPPICDKSFFQALKVAIQIERINKIILVNKPTSTSLSIFLSDKKNWAKFSVALKDISNKDWFNVLLDDFKKTVVTPLLSLGPKDSYKVFPSSEYRSNLNYLHNNFGFDLADNVDGFFRLWIDTLSYLKYFHENEGIGGMGRFRDNIELGLPTAAVASKLLFDVFTKHINDDVPPLVCDPIFLKELQIAIEVSVPKPDDTPGGPAIKEKGSGPQDTSDELFSNILEDARPLIEKINEIIGDAPSALSTFLSDKENWEMFSEALKNDVNIGWFNDLLADFKEKVVKNLRPLIVAEKFPDFITEYRKTLNDLLKFTFSSDKVDVFFRLWIKILGHLKNFHGDEKVSDYIVLSSLPTAAKASTEFFKFFEYRIYEGFPQGKKSFFQELKVVIQIETINKLILDDKPTSTSLSIFLSDKKNWAKFSVALKDVKNKDWFVGLGKLFHDSVYPSLFSPISTPNSEDNPVSIKNFKVKLQKFEILTGNPARFDNFLPLWIDILSDLIRLHDRKKEIEASKLLHEEDERFKALRLSHDEAFSNSINIDLLPTATVASKLLFDAFAKHINEGVHPFSDKQLLDDLKEAVKVKVTKSDDAPGGPPSVPPDEWSTQKKILVFGSIGVVIVSAILIVLLVLRKPRPAVVPTA